MDSKTHKKRILVVGSINIDRYWCMDRLPLPGETIDGETGGLRCGGKGANQAAALANLGFPVSLMANVGPDELATLAMEGLSSVGVDIQLVELHGASTGEALILLQDTGENSIVVSPGANAVWESRTIHDALIENFDVVLLQREIPDDVNMRVAVLAHLHQIPVILDLGGADNEISDQLLKQITILSPNETELARLVGFDCHDDASVERAADIVLAKGCQCILVKRGEKGCSLFEQGRAPIHVPAFSVDVMDTTGAGDCFTSAFAVNYVAGREYDYCLAFACAAAALCCQTIGAMDSMPSYEAVNTFMAQRVSLPAS